MAKSYGGKITYDKITRIDCFIRKLLRVSNFPKILRMPISVGYKKVKNYIITRNGFYSKMKKFLETKMV